MGNEQERQPPVRPDGPPEPGGYFVPPITPPVAAPGTFPGDGTAPAAGPPAGSWTLPPKPGLIPLRPLTLGDILTASFKVLKRNPRPTFGFALGMQLLIVVASALIVGLVSFTTLSRIATASVEDSYEVTAGSIAATVLASLVPAVLSVVVLALVQGILMLEIQRATLGEKLTLRQLWGRARGRLGALVGWMALVTVAVLIGIAVLVGAIVLLVATLGTVGIALGVVIGIFGGLGLLAAAAWLGTKLSLVPSVLMGERSSLRAAIARSWSLTSGYFWRTLGIQLLVSVILGVATQIVSTPIQFLAPMLVFLLDPNGTGGPVTVIVLVAAYLVAMLVVVVLSSVALVVQSATTALIYIDLRMRKEGLDLDLARFVEETHAGHAQVADPYLPDTHVSYTHGPDAASGYSVRPASPIPAENESPWA